MSDNKSLILASQSRFRAQLLSSAGIAFDILTPSLDERAVEEPLIASGLDGSDIALILAEAKAQIISEEYSEALVIGADQTLSFRGQLLHKPKDMEEARRRLLHLSGASHQLNSAVTLVKSGEIIWQHVETATITFRKLDPKFIGRHLAKAGKAALSSVGAYQIEGEGVQLFEKIEGDFFSIMGLPLLPLLKKLRQIGAIDG